jgi:hypothetical protein
LWFKENKQKAKTRSMVRRKKSQAQEFALKGKDEAIRIVLFHLIKNISILFPITSE